MASGDTSDIYFVDGSDDPINQQEFTVPALCKSSIKRSASQVPHFPSSFFKF